MHFKRGVVNEMVSVLDMTVEPHEYVHAVLQHVVFGCKLIEHTLRGEFHAFFSGMLLILMYPLRR